MKRFANLSSNLRALFGFLRVLTVVGGFFFVLYVVLNLAALSGWGGDIGPSVTMGEVALQADPAAIAVKTSDPKPGVLMLKSVRANLVAKPGKQDNALRLILLRTTVPSMLVGVVTSYMLFTALRRLCGNWEVGDLFNEENFGLVRRIGFILVVSSLLNAVLALWNTAVVGSFLQRHVSLGGGMKLLEFAGQTPFSPPASVLSIPHGLVIGCLVLMLTAAFRQGLKLKDENDLTV